MALRISQPAIVVDTLDALPAACAPLLAAGGFFGGADWWRTVVETALPAGTSPCFLLHAPDGQPAVLTPLLLGPGGASLQGLTTPYTCVFRPLAAADADPATLRAAGTALARHCRRWASVRIDALDADWPGLAPWLDGIGAGGLAVQRFEHFGNWHEPVAGLAWPDYLAGRPGALRETLRRRLRDAGRDRRLGFEIVRTPAELDRGIAAYEAAYARSWKEPEPFPRFNPALMRRTAAAGSLRLGILRRDDAVLAVQFWVVADGTAWLLKLAHDEEARAISPGTVLTAWMIRALLEADAPRELDFGRGDDPYKRLWTSRRRQRIGVLLLNPWRPAGLAAIGRQLAGRVGHLLRRHKP
jgi:hypothetical protein